jgi:hypothetical protein
MTLNLRPNSNLDFDTNFEIIRVPVVKKTEEDDTLGVILGVNLSREGRT